MKIAVIVQRYGMEINGGAELHARYLAEKLSKNHEITVLTSKSLDYSVWGNYFLTDQEVLNGIKVLRFDTAEKNHKKFRKYRRIVLKMRKVFHMLRLQKIFDKYNLLQPNKKHFENWLINQGPYLKDLPDYLVDNYNNYDIFIFFTYLYYPTAYCLPLVKGKSMFIPTAHDETVFYINGYKTVFENARFIMYNSLSEKRLVEKTYPQSKLCLNDIAGLGIEQTKFPLAKPYIDAPYLIYIGRIDGAKNAGELIEWFEKYVKNSSKLKLVLVGKNVAEYTAGSSVIFTGFISDEEKFNWLSYATALVIPSKHESLSMVTLEAMELGIPVIANAHCEVLYDHIQLSEAGFAYSDYNSFSDAINRVVHFTEAEKESIRKKGMKYVSENYNWENILLKFEKAFRLFSEH